MRKLIKAGELECKFIETNFQVAYFLSKGLAREKLESFRRCLGLKEAKKTKDQESKQY